MLHWNLFVTNRSHQFPGGVRSQAGISLFLLQNSQQWTLRLVLWGRSAVRMPKASHVTALRLARVRLHPPPLRQTHFLTKTYWLTDCQSQSNSDLTLTRWLHFHRPFEPTPVLIHHGTFPASRPVRIGTHDLPHSPCAKKVTIYSKGFWRWCITLRAIWFLDFVRHNR
jgi:hypothetical protein